MADAWAAGDDAAVPNLASPTPGAFTVPNAQNAVRQGKLLAKNVIRALRGRDRRTMFTTASARSRHSAWGRGSSSTAAS